MDVIFNSSEGVSSEASDHPEKIISVTNDLKNIIISEEDPIHDIIDYLAHKNLNVCFKSQQIGESDLNVDQKKEIALNLYSKGMKLFLTKFGEYLTSNQLDYFKKSSFGDGELEIIVTQLQKLLDNKNRKLVAKNRRYEALTKMLKNDSYFSETEMMKRNPLLYEQLIGQYLTEKEKKERDNIDTENITLLNVLLETMDRRHIKDLMEEQQSKEECSLEESDDESNMNESSDEDCGREQASKWGEYEESLPTAPAKKAKSKSHCVTASERELLREEFVQEMYRSFLAGEDDNVDYEAIDNSAEYDCLDVRERDEEEKYFDSETPEEVEMQSNAEIQNKDDSSKVESDDELDVYMQHLNSHPNLRNLSQF